MNTDGISALDRMLAAQASPVQIARELIAEARTGLEPFCDIPEGYRDCRLDHTTCSLDDLSEVDTRALIENPSGAIVNPTTAHLRAMEFFRMVLEGDPLVCEKRDPLRPTLGAYLVGPPGVGKTHIMAAFGLRIKQQLDKEMAKMESTIVRLIERLYNNTLDQQEEWSRLPLDEDNRWTLSVRSPSAMNRTDNETDVMRQAMQGGIQMTKRQSPEDRFAASVTFLQHRVRTYVHQPTDLLYLGFEDLFDQLQRDEVHRKRTLSALEMARVLFVDDIHPKGDPARILVIQQLIERRYELDRPGTFLTTNLTAEELGAGNRTVAQRLLSRCSENFIKFDFKDCTDWRMTVKSRRIGLIEKVITERLAQTRGPNNTPDDIRQPADVLPKSSV
jgi:DNA replication protein DnaC